MLTSPGRFADIRTERLTIKPLTVAYPHHVDALNNREYMKYSEQRHVTHDLATQEVYLRTAGPDCVLLDLANYFGSIGSMSCYLDHQNGVADLGLMIVPEACRHGYGREAWAAVMTSWLEKGFKVEAGVMTGNVGMICICARTGMEFEGIRNNHFKDGERRTGLALWGKSGLAMWGTP